jgi:hypothetical protein
LEILANYIDVHQNLRYLHQNPVEAGFVTKQKEYLYSSVRNYYDGKGLIELSFIH